MTTQPRVLNPTSERQTCDGHMLSGRPAVHVIEIGGQPRLSLCNECAASIHLQLGKRKPARPEAKPIDPETLGPGKGPDFRMLPVTPPRVRP